MLLLQPLLEPNGENGSEKKKITHTTYIYNTDFFQVKHEINCLDKHYLLTSGNLCELLRVPPLLHHQAQGCLADCFPTRRYRSGEEVGVVLRDEAGGHISSLKLWVPRKT